MSASAGVTFAGGGLGAVVGAFLITSAYFLPTIIAWARKVTNVGSVFVVNFFLGWTFVGWIVALAMAVKTRLPPSSSNQVVMVSSSPTDVAVKTAEPKIPKSQTVHQFVPIVSSGKKCAHCEEPFTWGTQFCMKCGEPVISTAAERPADDQQISKWCDNCSKEIDRSAKFCPQCGSPAEEVNVWKCLECNGDIALEDEFCQSCGTPC